MTATVTTGEGDSLEAFRAVDAAQPVSAAATAAATAAAARFGDAARAVIFYGSCLRDGHGDDAMFDFYVIVDSYRHAYGKPMPAVANAVLPPNVFYMETPFEDDGPLRAKVAVLSSAQLRALSRPRTFNPTLWARLAQPVRVPVAADTAAREAVIQALADALRTLAQAVLPLLPETFTAAQFWHIAFAQTYRSELRAERAGRGGNIYETETDFFDTALQHLAAEPGGPLSRDPESGLYRRREAVAPRWRAVLVWRLRHIQGKTLTLLRLVKAGFTFEGGADYLAWKIARHSGVSITLTPWQRRHPILTGFLLFGRLWRRRAFR